MEALIPDHSFEHMPQFMLIVVALTAIYALIRGADILVESAAGMAYRMGIPKIIVGATIVSLGTTSPECAVSVMAAWSGNAGLALGNAVGSIIADTGLIFGLGCAMVVLPADKFVLKRQGWTKIATDVLLIGLCYTTWFTMGDEATLGRAVGILLCVLLVGYLLLSVYWARQHNAAEKLANPTVQPVVSEHEEHATELAHKSMGMMVLWLFIGLVVVIFASRFLVGSATEVALRWGIPQVVIAATLVAFGTSLPELMVGMSAIRKGHYELLVGNIIGADILNVLFVVGVSAIARPLPIIDPSGQIPAIFLYLHLPTMLIMTSLFMFYIFSAIKHGSFRRWQGYPLLALYVIYVVLQFVLTV